MLQSLRLLRPSSRRVPRSDRWRSGLALLLALLLTVASALLSGGLGGDRALAAGSAGSSSLAGPSLTTLKEAILMPDPEAVPGWRKVPGPSPAATITRFLALTARAEATIRHAVHQGLREPGPQFSPAVRRQVEAAVQDLQQATQALDLSEVPVALRPMSGVGTLLMLRSVLSYDLSHRADLAIPDGERVRREQLSSWTVPDTGITLMALTPTQVQQGLACSQCSQGDFLFSTDTLVQVPEAFAQVFAGRDNLQRRYGADLYSYWALIPGGALPPKLFMLQPLAVRRFLLTPMAGQSLLQWVLLIPGTLLVLAAAVWWIRNLRRWQLQRGELQGVVPHLLGLLAVLPLLLLVWAWQWFAIDWINLIGPREAAVLVIVRLAEGLLQAVLVFLLAETGGQLVALRRHRDLSGVRTLARRKGSGQILTLARLVGVLGAMVVLIRTGQDLGLTSLTLLGLASVPALAISLGTQQLIRDIADGFSLLLDGQLRGGDRCTIGTSKSGVIKGRIASLGMRSMRIRQDDGSILSIPNSQVASSVVTNHRFSTLTPLQLTLPIVAEALPQAQALLEQARRLLADSPALEEARADLDAGDAGWSLRFRGSWSSDLSVEEQRAAQEELYLQLIQLTHPGAAAELPGGRSAAAGPAPGASA